MRADIQDIKRTLKVFDFQKIFNTGLGWDNPPRESGRSGNYQGQPYVYTLIAQKKGFRIYQCEFQARIPNEQALKQIDRPQDTRAEEHLTIFVDAAQENQAWFWVKKELNQPAATHLNRLNKNQSGELLAQKIARLFVSIDEESTITLTSILDRVNLAFDTEKVTNQFYKEFQEKHAYFLEHIENIPDEDDRKWYTSIMLNRLMFVYFLQRKGLLNNTSSIRLEVDQFFLQHCLTEVRSDPESTTFYEFYRYFLRRLFHEGLNLPENERLPDFDKKIGRVPYINGGLFDIHALERQYHEIRIGDEVFEKIFKFFEKFDWYLDDRPMRSGKEINPDVLGYIFEKYTNQKQMGAYYTKEDITGYISKDTIIPFLFTKVAGQFPEDFAAQEPIWSLLKDNPDEYIYEELAHGRFETLPLEIEAGVTDFAQRGAWNGQVGEQYEQYALPTETWREVVERRHRYDELRKRLADGEINTINDLITYNLNITRFAENAIATCKKPLVLQAFYNAIEQVTVLDPTCGSGAFLFAALNILRPLYQACIERMDALAKDRDRQLAQHRGAQDKDLPFQHILNRIHDHRSQDYFILKSIIINNLYGVDVMEEAVEICRLRLFLKLVAQIEKPNDLEPLPDIDFNVLAGNTLIGFTSMEEISQVTEKLFNVGNTEKTLAQIKFEIEDIERDEHAFRDLQIRQNIVLEATSLSTQKQRIREKLKNLRDKLDPYLATEYSITTEKYPDTYDSEYLKWHKSHQPFHWWIEFHEIMGKGGFDVIIGNPPYVEYSKVRDEYKVKGYKTESSGNLYNYVFEQCSKILKSPFGQLGMIIPLSGFFTERMLSYQDYIFERYTRIHVSHFSGDAHPSILFQGVKYRLSIILASRIETPSEIYTSKYNRWYADEREDLFRLLSYTKNSFLKGYLRFAKVGNIISKNVLTKMLVKKPSLGAYLRKNGKGHINYHRTPVFWIRAMNFEPYFHSATRERSLDHLKDLYFVSQKEADAIGAIINSTCFYYWFSIQGNCRDIASPDITSFPIGYVDDVILEKLKDAFNLLMEDLQKHSKRRVYNYEKSGRVEYQEFYSKYSKPAIDEIDRILAQHYGFTREELDFIINYDIKYRMGQKNGDEEGEE